MGSFPNEKIVHRCRINITFYFCLLQPPAGKLLHPSDVELAREALEVGQKIELKNVWWYNSDDDDDNDDDDEVVVVVVDAIDE